MIDEITKFMKKHNIQPSEINYLTRENRKTVFHMANNTLITTYLPVKDVLDVLSSYGFVSINKGIVINPDQIDHVDNGTYHMKDGTVLVGRRRSMGAHKRLARTLADGTALSSIRQDICSKFSVLDDMPLAFCVIELCFDPNGNGIDFIFRYCNRQMEILEGKKLTEMINQSFYKIFPNADRKWLVAYADVALNGNKRIISDFSPEIQQHLVIHCYQPEEGFCACLIFTADEIQNITNATGDMNVVFPLKEIH